MKMLKEILNYSQNTHRGICCILENKIVILFWGKTSFFVPTYNDLNYFEKGTSTKLH